MNDQERDNKSQSLGARTNSGHEGECYSRVHRTLCDSTGERMLATSDNFSKEALSWGWSRGLGEASSDKSAGEEHSGASRGTPGGATYGPCWRQASRI